MFEHTNTNPLECYGNMLTSKVHSEVQPFAHGGHQPQKFGTRIWKYILQAMYIQMNLCVLENVFILQHKNTSCKWHTRNLQCKRHVDRCSSFLKNAQKISWHRRRWEFATWKYIKKSIQYICPISTSIVLYETKRIKNVAMTATLLFMDLQQNNYWKGKKILTQWVLFSSSFVQSCFKDWKWLILNMLEF